MNGLPNFNCFPCFYLYPARGFTMSDMQETEYKGVRIVETLHRPEYKRFDTMGFDVGRVYAVVDEFDSPALPVIYHTFWSPLEAKNAIDICEYLDKAVAEKRKRWPTTVTYEFTEALQYRNNFGQVFVALKQIEQMCLDAQDLGEDMTEDVLKALRELRRTVTV